MNSGTTNNNQINCQSRVMIRRMTIPDRGADIDDRLLVIQAARDTFVIGTGGV